MTFTYIGFWVIKILIKIFLVFLKHTLYCAWNKYYIIAESGWNWFMIFWAKSLLMGFIFSWPEKVISRIWIFYEIRLLFTKIVIFSPTVTRVWFAKSHVPLLLYRYNCKCVYIYAKYKNIAISSSNFPDSELDCLNSWKYHRIRTWLLLNFSRLQIIS